MQPQTDAPQEWKGLRQHPVRPGSFHMLCYQGIFGPVFHAVRPMHSRLPV